MKLWDGLNVMNKETYIKQLCMERHPEGGYFQSHYKNPLSISTEFGARALSTSIYFLIEKEDFSAYHSIKSDEMWYFHDGDPLEIHMIDLEGNHHMILLGLDVAKGQVPQFVVPANMIFASCPHVSQHGYSLVGCNVSFGFDFEDFHLFTRDELLQRYPHLMETITKLTR